MNEQRANEVIRQHREMEGKAVAIACKALQHRKIAGRVAIKNIIFRLDSTFLAFFERLPNNSVSHEFHLSLPYLWDEDWEEKDRKVAEEERVL